MSTGNSSENVFDTTDVFIDTAVSFDTVAKAAETLT